MTLELPKSDLLSVRGGDIFREERDLVRLDTEALGKEWKWEL